MITKLEALLGYYDDLMGKGRQEMDRAKVIGFALFSTRRLGEITNIKWNQVDDEGQRVLIKDMKGAGADTWCHVPDEAWVIINSIPRNNDGPFPYSVTSINASFNKACKVLKIKDLSFYDLRDEGIARLFEMGWDAPKVASVSGHLELGALGKYADLSGTGGQYKGWCWVEKIVASESVL